MNTMQNIKHPEKLTDTLPTLRQLTRPTTNINIQATRVCEALAQHLPQTLHVTTSACHSQIGSGALPVETIPSLAVAITSVAEKDSELRILAREFRRLPYPVIGRIHDGQFLLDIRCLDSEEIFLQQLPQLSDALSC